MTDASNIIFVGGPDSGKSNYLFRAWLALERKSGRLVKDGLPADADYLHVGASVLIDGKFAPHTPHDVRTTCLVPIAKRDTPTSRNTLVMPDAEGEFWVRLYEKREWPVSWDELVTQGFGVLLFVRAGSKENVPALDWVTAERLWHNRPLEPLKGTPTQVQLVDWLQILRSIADRRLGPTTRIRLSVIVAAWDAVPLDRQQEPPQNYLDLEFPMLSQFLASGLHGFDARVFGVSLFGGDPQLDPEFRKVFDSSDPSKLGYTVQSTQAGMQKDADVLRPIYWAIGDSL